MIQTIDLDRYFARIGYAGSRLPTLETLREIHVRHAATIAFENLDPLLGTPIRLDAESLERKLVRDRARRLLLRAEPAASPCARRAGLPRDQPFGARVVECPGGRDGHAAQPHAAAHQAGRPGSDRRR